ncbi:hypothetical protein F2P56_027353 [Juglans regia]|uniref:Reverse transcriptase domain-containing protein n=1 Tax=Juglans regia TaxID=51240 RepID=A0A833TPD3_JUGRE|nr:hypothetical protein F2P56_027353 [Juglans regia]
MEAIVDAIPLKVTAAMYEELMKPYFEEEVKSALFQMQPLKTQGPDDLNETFVVLIPKDKKSENMKDFRPISLCNAVYKIIAKIIVNRLKIILPPSSFRLSECFCTRSPYYR